MLLDYRNHFYPGQELMVTGSKSHVGVADLPANKAPPVFLDTD